MNDKERLYFDALNEIAECIGDSLENPVSLSLLCLRLGISNEEKGKIFVEFNQVLRQYKFDELELKIFKDALNNICPMSKKIADIVVAALVKAYARNLIPELYPFAKTLD